MISYLISACYKYAYDIEAQVVVEMAFGPLPSSADFAYHILRERHIFLLLLKVVLPFEGCTVDLRLSDYRTRPLDTWSMEVQDAVKRVYEETQLRF